MQLLPLVHKTLGHATGLLASIGVFTAIDFTHQITLGSVILTFVIIAIAGVFTIRSKVAQVWRDDAEGQRMAKQRLQEELGAEKAARLKFEKEQQEVRHDLKDKVSELTAQLKVMEAKTDLTSALEAIKTMNEQTVHAISTAVVDAMHKTSALSEKRDEETHHLLAEIRDKLPDEPISRTDQPIEVRDITSE